MFRSGAAPGQTLAEGLISAERSALLPGRARPPGSSLDDKEPLVAAWTRSALAASERVRRGVGRGTHPTRTGYRALHRRSRVIQRDRTRSNHREVSATRPAANAVASRVLLSPVATGGARRCPVPLPQAVPTVPSAGRGCLSALASVVHLILTAIATRARQVSETV
jgi:hypothetical protein